MQFVLIAEHPDRPRPIMSLTTALDADRYAMLHAGTLSDAAKISAHGEGKTPLLRIHLTCARPLSNATEIAMPPRRASIVSLIHDASLLRIADGAVITTDNVGDKLLVEAAASTLAGLGYRISSISEPPDEQDVS